MNKREYCYRRLESCGRVFFRILERAYGGYWTMARGTFDYDREEDAVRRVKELEKGKP